MCMMIKRNKKVSTGGKKDNNKKTHVDIWIEKEERKENECVYKPSSKTKSILYLQRRSLDLEIL